MITPESAMDFAFANIVGTWPDFFLIRLIKISIYPFYLEAIRLLDDDEINLIVFLSPTDSKKDSSYYKHPF